MEFEERLNDPPSADVLSASVKCMASSECGQKVVMEKMGGFRRGVIN